MTLVPWVSPLQRKQVDYPRLKFQENYEQGMI